MAIWVTAGTTPNFSPHCLWTRKPKLDDWDEYYHKDENPIEIPPHRFRKLFGFNLKSEEIRKVKSITVEFEERK